MMRVVRCRHRFPSLETFKISLNVGHGSEQPDLVGVPAHCRGIAPDGLEMSLPAPSVVQDISPTLIPGRQAQQVFQRTSQAA